MSRPPAIETIRVETGPRHLEDVRSILSGIGHEIGWEESSSEVDFGGGPCPRFSFWVFGTALVMKRMKSSLFSKVRERYSSGNRRILDYETFLMVRSNCRFASDPDIFTVSPDDSPVLVAEKALAHAVATGRPATLVLDDGSSISIAPSDFMFFHRGVRTSLRNGRNGRNGARRP